MSRKIPGSLVVIIAVTIAAKLLDFPTENRVADTGR